MTTFQHKAGGLPMARRSTPFDKEIGIRIRRLRRDAGLSQSQLAELIGVTFQQVQKYESGKNRISAAKLREISRMLGCSVLDLLESITPLAMNETEGHILTYWRSLPSDEHRQFIHKLMGWLKSDLTAHKPLN